MRLSKREKAVFQVMKDNLGKPFTVEDIAEIYFGERERSKNWYTQVCGFMAKLENKTRLMVYEGNESFLVHRFTPLGRGSKAQYRCE